MCTPESDDTLEREMRLLGQSLQRLYAVERSAVPDDMDVLIGRLARAIDDDEKCRRSGRCRAESGC